MLTRAVVDAEKIDMKIDGYISPFIKTMKLLI